MLTIMQYCPPGSFRQRRERSLAHLLGAYVLRRPCRSKHILYQGGYLARNAQEDLGIYKAGLILATKEQPSSLQRRIRIPYPPSLPPKATAVKFPGRLD